MTHSVCAPSVHDVRAWNNKTTLKFTCLKEISHKIVWCNLLRLKCTKQLPSTYSFHCLLQQHPTKRWPSDTWTSPLFRPPDPSSFAHCRQAVTASETQNKNVTRVGCTALAPGLIVSIVVLGPNECKKEWCLFYFRAKNCGKYIWLNCSHPSNAEKKGKLYFFCVQTPQCLGLWENLIVTKRRKEMPERLGFRKFHIKSPDQTTILSLRSCCGTHSKAFRQRFNGTSLAWRNVTYHALYHGSLSNHQDLRVKDGQGTSRDIYIPTRTSRFYNYSSWLGNRDLSPWFFSVKYLHNIQPLHGEDKLGMLKWNVV